MNLGEGRKKAFKTFERISGGFNYTLPASFEWKPGSSERRQIRITSYQIDEIKMVLKQIGRYIHSKF